MSETLPDAVDRVADYTAALDLEGHDWQRAVAINGLLAVDRHVERARELVDRAVETQTSEGMLAYGWGDYPRGWREWTEYDVSDYKPTTNNAAMAWSVLEFYRRTGEERYLDAVRRQYGFFETVERTEDGGISRRADRIELFTEPIYFLAPWFVRYGRTIDDEGPIEEAIHQIEVHLKHLQDPHTGLFRHIWRETPNSYPQGSFWSRGNGWAIAGLADTLSLLEDPERREPLAVALGDNLETLVGLQDASGFWHQVLDDATTPLEASGTLASAYALKRAAEMDLVPEDPYLDAARRGVEACAGIVDDEGAVRRVSKPPASARSPLGVTPYGQGWFLLAAGRFGDGTPGR